MKKLPVFQSFREVYTGVWRHFLDLARVAWLPLAIVVAARFSFTFWVDPQFGPLGHSSAHEQAVLSRHAPAILIISLSLWLGTAMMAVGFHRFVLLGERTRGLLGSGLSFGRKELLYVWSSFLVGVALTPPLLVTGLLTGFVAAALVPPNAAETPAESAGGMLAGMVLASCLLVGGLFMGRWMLVLPHVALGNSSSLRFVWRQTRGNSWRLLRYMILVFLPLALLLLVSFSARALGPLFGAMFEAPVYVLMAMVSVTYLSVAYREIVGLPEEAAPEVPAGSLPA